MVNKVQKINWEKQNLFFISSSINTLVGNNIENRELLENIIIDCIDFCISGGKNGLKPRDLALRSISQAKLLWTEEEKE